MRRAAKTMLAITGVAGFLLWAGFRPTGTEPASTGSTEAVSTRSAVSSVASTTNSAKNTKSRASLLLSLGSRGVHVLKLQEQLSSLGYLPLRWTRIPNIPTKERVAWRWAYQHTPESLQMLWQPGSYTVVTKGAVMAFESADGLAVDGVAGPQVANALASDIKAHRTNQHGYAYVYVTERIPERLVLWFNGKTVLNSLANTGISQSPTVPGTWPVYLRYTSQTMSGTMPNGEHYSDPGVPWVNYFNGGDAVHGFVRSSYGTPQSLGCVEIPVSAAKIAWGYITYGTLVTVLN